MHVSSITRLNVTALSQRITNGDRNARENAVLPLNKSFIAITRLLSASFASDLLVSYIDNRFTFEVFLECSLQKCSLIFQMLAIGTVGLFYSTCVYILHKIEIRLIGLRFIIVTGEELD